MIDGTESINFGTTIVGGPSAIFQGTGVFVYSTLEGDMTVNVTGRSGNYARIESDLIPIGTYIIITASSDQPALGTVTLQWNGISPCGKVAECVGIPSRAPSPEPELSTCPNGQLRITETFDPCVAFGDTSLFIALPSETVHAIDIPEGAQNVHITMTHDRDATFTCSLPTFDFNRSI